MLVQVRLQENHYVVSSGQLDLYGVGHTPEETREDYLTGTRECYANLSAHADQLSAHLEEHLTLLQRIFGDAEGGA
jgi:hypothetical protein